MVFDTSDMKFKYQAAFQEAQVRRNIVFEY